MMPATKSWEGTLERLADMTPHCFYIAKKIENRNLKEQAEDPTSCLVPLGEFLL